jgi:hypothetical protein
MCVVSILLSIMSGMLRAQKNYIIETPWCMETFKFETFKLQLTTIISHINVPTMSWSMYTNDTKTKIVLHLNENDKVSNMIDTITNHGF